MKIPLHYNRSVFPVTFWRPQHALGWIAGWSMPNCFWKRHLSHLLCSAQPQATLWRELREWGLRTAHCHTPWFCCAQSFPPTHKRGEQSVNTRSTFSNLFSIQTHGRAVVTQWLACRVVAHICSVKGRSSSHLATFWNTGQRKKISKVLGIHRVH